MLKKYDLHTHTFFSDGKFSPEEMILSAIDHGFAAIGITDHAYAGDEVSWWMSKEKTKEYISLIPQLKEKYKDKITVLLGTEFDAFSLGSLDPYDYVIGSVHFVEKNGKWWPIDSTKEEQAEGINAFGGDPYAFCKEYYRLLKKFADVPKIKIVGHFDLLEKFNENNDVFDRTDTRYLDCALDALHTLNAAGKAFEINTGAMFRVGRSTPYPNEIILKELARIGGRICFGSDAHSTKAVGFNFDVAAALCEKYGLKTLELPIE
ncbi:MAG: histidinol-phosphatase [Clostridia bacterium]|nr:histidinol-phosphatase [Clostridia bacterium]